MDSLKLKQEELEAMYIFNSIAEEKKDLQVPCTCPCHTNPGIMHIQACCDYNGMVSIPRFGNKLMW
jgi:hypothetical protein